jgi:serine/threonine protein kinase
VYLARRNGEAYALKQLSKDKLLAMNQMKYALIELRALQRCRGCKYVIPLYFAFQTMDYLYLAIKYVSSGDLGMNKVIQRSRSKRRVDFPTKKPLLSSLS